MGYESFTATGKTLRDKYRAEFPVTEHVVYLNHAAVAPLCRPAAEAMKRLTDDACLYGSLHYSDWLDAYQGLRVAAAKLIGGDPREIAITKNTSEGISTVATGMQWKAGDKIVVFREEFPSNYFPWLRLECNGVQLEWLSCFDPLEKIEQATRGAKLLALSYVQYLSGFRADLEAVGDICDRHGVFFFVDAIQGMGAFPIDVRKAKIHALAADGHKWMLGPEGCGILYVQSDWQDRIEPVEFGWTNIAGYADYSCRDMKLRDDAGRYECGTLNTVGTVGLRASIEFLLEVGIEEIATTVQGLGDQIEREALAKGYETMFERTPATGAGIVSIRKEGHDCRVLVSRLKDAGFSVAARQGWVRIAPHFYISPDEISALTAALP